MFILLQQNSEEGGGPFETQPAAVRGNCINQSNPERFPLGYFRLSEVDEIMYLSSRVIWALPCKNKVVLSLLASR